MENSDIRLVAIEEIEQSVQRDREHPVLVHIMNRHSLRYKRALHRVHAQETMALLFELYLYARCYTESDAESSWLPDHFFFFRNSIRNFALNYSDAYEPGKQVVTEEEFSSDNARVDFVRNFEFFCTTEPSIDAHRLLYACILALFRVHEQWLWSIVPSTEPAEKPVDRQIFPLTMNYDDYKRLKLNGRAANAIRFSDEPVIDEPDMPEESRLEHYVALYKAASELCLDEAGDYDEAMIKQVLKEFCDKINGPAMEYLIQIAYGEDAPEASEKCKSFYFQISRAMEFSEGRKLLDPKYSERYPEAGRKALQFFCSLVTGDECLIQGPVAMWMIRIARLESEWHAAELNA